MASGFERIPKEAAVVEYDAVPTDLPEGTEKKKQKTSVTITGASVRIRTWRLKNTSHTCYRLSQLARFRKSTEILDHYFYTDGPDSSVGIATGYGLDGPGIESRWGARFSAPVQTGTGAHPASCTMGTGSFPGVKSGRGVTLTPYPLPVPWSKKGRAILQLPL